MESEISRYKHQQRDLENYERKIGTLQGELERMGAQHKNRLMELDDWKNKCSKLEITINSYSVYERENKDLQDRLNMQTRVIE